MTNIFHDNKNSKNCNRYTIGGPTDRVFFCGYDVLNCAKCSHERLNRAHVIPPMCCRFAVSSSLNNQFNLIQFSFITFNALVICVLAKR